MRIAGIVLAGGASRRMGSPKPLLTLGGETFVDRLVRTFRVECDPVIIVLGHNAAAVERVMERRGEAAIVINPEPELGQLSSLQCALRVTPRNCDAVMFTPVDCPSLQAATVTKLAQAMKERYVPVVVPQYQGRHGHPVCVRSDVAAELLALPPERRASDVIHSYRGQTLYLDVDDSGVVDDIDDPEAYSRLTSGVRT